VRWHRCRDFGRREDSDDRPRDSRATALSCDREVCRRHGVTDNTNVDSYQVIKGPQQALYPLASLGGLVLRTSKKPLAGRSQTSLDLKVQQWGRTTFTFETNQPLANVGEAKFTYRLVGIAQNGKGPLYNSKDDRNGIYPSLAFDWKDTNVILQYGILTYKYLPGGTGILTPDNEIYTGLGHRNQNSPPTTFIATRGGDIRLSLMQHLSSTPSASTAGMFSTRPTRGRRPRGHRRSSHV